MRPRRGQAIVTAQPAAQHAAQQLTGEQRAIVEHGEGPLVVIAGAGTGKTRVMVERVAHLLATDATLAPEHLLVLTYNVKAARELRERIEERIGPARAARLSVSNFHSFCHRVLRESASEASMPPNPDVLDGVGQLLLIRELRPSLDLVYHGDWSYADFVKFINRAKDELVTPDDFDAFVDREQRIFEDRYGSYADATQRLITNGNLRPVRDVRSSYARLRRDERADRDTDPDAPMKAADLAARRAVGGTGGVMHRSRYTPEEQARIDELADTYVRDGAALEVMRWREIASVYRAYQEELTRRGALDFGEQIAAVTQLFKRRPNILRRWQRQFRHILVDEFQDANIAQIELIELLGRTPDRPDNVMVVGDDDQSIYRFRGASFAAFAEFDRRFSRPPAQGAVEALKGGWGPVFVSGHGDASAVKKLQALGASLLPEFPAEISATVVRRWSSQPLVVDDPARSDDSQLTVFGESEPVGRPKQSRKRTSASRRIGAGRRSRV